MSHSPNRRSFLSAALAASLLPGQRASAEENRFQPRIAPVVYRPPGGPRVRLDRVLLSDPSGRIYGDSLAQGALRYREDRLPLTRFVGGVFRPVPRDRIAEAQRVGSVHLSGNTLILRPFSSLVAPGGTPHLVLAHRNLSWEPGALRPIRDGSASAQAAQIGQLYREGDGLLAVLQPLG
ncbi:MAG: hypothetical protein AAGF68_06730 [Pseudomonadota bacterium]